MASHLDTDSSAKSETEEIDSRKAPIIIIGVGPQMLPNSSRQLRQMTIDIQTFSFGPLFYKRLDEEEDRLRRADNSNYLPGNHHSPDLDYHNSEDRRDLCDHGLKSPENLACDTTPNSREI